MSSRATITVVGLGYGDPEMRSVAAQRALDAAERIIFRTAVHAGIEDLRDDPRVVACDDIYDQLKSFESVYRAVVDRVLSTAADGPVVYAVPGSPHFGERTVRLLVEQAQGHDVSVAILPSVSSLDAIAAAVGLDILSDQVQVYDAEWLVSLSHSEPFSGGTLAIDPTRPVIVAQVFDRRIAADVKLALSRMFPDEHPAHLLRSAGIEGRVENETVPLCEIDREAVDHLTSLALDPIGSDSDARTPIVLARLISRLRAPGGCPWDRKQTPESLRDKILEEAFELADALDEDESEAIAGELGDLLLLVALLSQIAEEEGLFSIEEVYGEVNAKIVRRHPHIFGDVSAKTPDEVLSTWKSVKAQERGEGPEEQGRHRYDELPRSMSVIQRIRNAERYENVRPPRETDDMGTELLALVTQALSQGIDPEAALERAYRRTFAGEACP
jgi:tetrapyrrole methylase family protein / MazG family protein